MNHIAQDIFLKLGVSAEEQRTAALRARKTKTRLRPSARLMAAITGTGDVLSTWRRDKRYRGSDGSPRVLSIRGPGATLETLVRKCVPQMTLEEVLAFICSHGEATLYKGDRVACLGGCLRPYAKNAGGNPRVAANADSACGGHHPAQCGDSGSSGERSGALPTASRGLVIRERLPTVREGYVPGSCRNSAIN